MRGKGMLPGRQVAGLLLLRRKPPDSERTARPSSLCSRSRYTPSLETGVACRHALQRPDRSPVLFFIQRFENNSQTYTLYLSLCLDKRYF